jgi:hypothetical protein
MTKSVGFCVAVLLLFSVAVTGIPGMDLEEPVLVASKVSRTEVPIETPVTIVPPAPDGGSAVSDSDTETACGITVPVPEPLPDPDPGPEIPLPPVPEEPWTGEPVRMDVLFCLDTTGSMGDEIAVAKETILDIMAAVEEGSPPPDVRYALVIYRDLEDSYVTIVHDFMAPDEMAQVLQLVEAGEGGDYPESVSEALTRSVLDVHWDVAASCAIYLIGDAPPHLDYDNGYDHVEAAEMALDLGIVINAIGCSGIKGSEEPFMQVVNLTGGQFVYLNYTGGYTRGGGEGAYYSCDVACDVEMDHSVFCCDSAPGTLGGRSKSVGGGDNNLDEVLTDMLRSMAMDEGVEYDD